MNPHTITTVKCANCGKIRGESNHWFEVKTWEGLFLCRPFDPNDGLEDDERPVCGQGCAQKEFETWMTAKRNAPEPDAFLDFQIKQERHAHSTDTENSAEMYQDQGVK